MNALIDIPEGEAVLDPNKISLPVCFLRNAVTKAALVVERRNCIPIIGTIRIVPDRDHLIISATDLDMMLDQRIPASVGKKVKKPFALPLATMQKLLRGAGAGEQVTMIIDADTLSMQIGPVTATLRLIHEVSEFPEVEANTQGGIVETPLPIDALAKIIRNCRPAISTEKTRYYLNGIYLHAVDGRLCGVATDGHRLVKYTTQEIWLHQPKTVHAKTLSVLSKMLLTAADDLKVRSWGEAAIMQVAGADWTLTAKTIDGKYPDYPRVIPQVENFTAHAVLSAAGLARFPLSDFGIGGNRLKLDLTAKMASINLPSEDIEVSAPIEASGDFSVGFNLTYLRDFAKLHDTIRLDLTDKGTAALVRAEDPDFLGVVMPMRVLWCV